MKNGNKTTSLEEQVNVTRDDIVNKLHLIEDKIEGQIEGARQTLKTAKDKVSGWVYKMNLKDNFQAHPLSMVGGSVLFGLALGMALAKPADSESHEASASKKASSPKRPRIRTAIDSALTEFADEIHLARGALVAVGLKVLQEKAGEKAPKFSPYLDAIAKRVHTKLGLVLEPHQEPRPK